MDHSWRLHLTNRTIQHLDILEGTPPILAVWYRRDRVAFYHLETGVAHEEMSVTKPDTDDYASLEWQNFVAGLVAPNKRILPYVRAPKITIYTDRKKSFRIYQLDGQTIKIQKGVDTQSLQLPEDFTYRVFGFDEDSGAFALMNRAGDVHVYRHGTLTTSTKLDLNVGDELSTKLGLSKNGSVIYATDGRKLIKKDLTGESSRERAGNYLIRQMHNTSDGKFLVTSDLDTGVIRIYDGHELEQTHQSFAIDLVSKATQLQLIADLPPISAAVSALAISNSGIVALAIYGVVCVTHIDLMNAVPDRA